LASSGPRVFLTLSFHGSRVPQSKMARFRREIDVSRVVAGLER
jgi:hypothetical protein